MKLFTLCRFSKKVSIWRGGRAKWNLQSICQTDFGWGGFEKRWRWFIRWIGRCVVHSVVSRWRFCLCTYSFASSSGREQISRLVFRKNFTCILENTRRRKCRTGTYIIEGWRETEIGLWCRAPGKQSQRMPGWSAMQRKGGKETETRNGREDLSL